MTARFPDWVWTMLLGAALVAVAGAMAFRVHSGVAWFYALLPGAWILVPLLSLAFRSNAFADVLSVVANPLIFGLSFIWYFCVALAGIKGYRFLRAG